MLSFQWCFGRLGLFETLQFRCSAIFWVKFHKFVVRPEFPLILWFAKTLLHDLTKCLNNGNIRVGLVSKPSFFQHTIFFIIYGGGVILRNPSVHLCLSFLISIPPMFLVLIYLHSISLMGRSEKTGFYR